MEQLQTLIYILSTHSVLALCIICLQKHTHTHTLAHTQREISLLLTAGLQWSSCQLEMRQQMFVLCVCVCLCVSPLLRKCFWFYSSIGLGIGDFTFKSQIYSNIVTQYLCICTVVHLRVCRLLIFKAACGWSLEVKGHHLDCEAHTSHFLALLSVHSSALYISHS